MFGLVKQSTYDKAIKVTADLAALAAPGIQTALYGLLNKNSPVYDWDNKKDYVNKAFQGNGDVYSIVDWITTKLAMCPLILYEVTKENQTKAIQYKALQTNPGFAAQVKAKTIQLKALKETYNNNINDLLNKPNKLQTPNEWLTQYAGFLLLTGNSYNYYNGMNGEDSKYWTEMFTLPAHIVNIISGGEWQPVSGYNIIGSRNYNLKEVDFSAKQVSHIKKFNPDFTSQGNQLYGQSPLRAYIKTLIRDADSREELHKQIKNGGAMGIFSPAPGAPQIAPEVKNDIKATLHKARNSKELAERIIVSMASGQWQQIGLPSVDLQVIESLTLNEKDFCKCYHFPPQLLANTEASTDNNMQWAGKQAIYNCVMPWGNMISDRLTRDICPQNEKTTSKYFLMFDYSVLPELSEDQDKVASWLTKSYWITNNEKREVQGYGRLEGVENMDVPLVPNNLTRVDDLAVTDTMFTDAAKGATEL